MTAEGGASGPVESGGAGHREPLLPIACSLGDAERAARIARLRRRVLPAVRGATELDDGWALRFEWSPERIRDLADLLALESDCCAFLRFRLEIEPGRGPVRVTVTGPGEAKRLLEAGLLDALPYVPGDERPPAAGAGVARRLRPGGTAVLAASGLALLACASPVVVGVLAAAGLGGVVSWLDPLALVGLGAGGALLVRGRKGRC